MATRISITIIILLILINCSSSIKITSKNTQPSVGDIESIFIAHNLTKKSIAEFLHKSFKKNDKNSIISYINTSNIDSLHNEALSKEIRYLIILEGGGIKKAKEYKTSTNTWKDCQLVSASGAVECDIELDIVNIRLYKVSDPLIYWDAKIYIQEQKGKEIAKTLVSQMIADGIINEKFKAY